MGTNHEGLGEMALITIVSRKEEKKEAQKGWEKGKWKNKKKGGFGPNRKIQKKLIKCNKCGKPRHFANECRLDCSKMECYNYDQIGHLKWTCKAPPRAPTQTSIQIVPSYTVKVVPISSELVAHNGKKIVFEVVLTLSSLSIHTLFDTEASHSFISSKLVEWLALTQ